MVPEAEMYVNDSSVSQYKLFLAIRRRFLQERLQTGVGSYLLFSRCHIFVSFRKHTVLDFCRHQ